jgi:hypothetical protein
MLARAGKEEEEIARARRGNRAGRIGSWCLEHGISGMKLSPSMLVSFGYREVGNRARECCGYETNLFSLLPISYKNFSCADGSL